jgi:hypothetical protein
MLDAHCWRWMLSIAFLPGCSLLLTWDPILEPLDGGSSGAGGLGAGGSGSDDAGAVGGSAAKSPGGQAGLPAGSGGGGTAGTQTGEAGGAAPGGAPSAGAAGASGAANRFQGGPCVVRPDQTTNVIIFARSAQNIYQATVAPGGGATWTPVVDSAGTRLQASMVSDTSDLDCSGYAPAIQIVALSGVPLGNILLASGDGTVFGQFSSINSKYTFTSGPAVYTGASTAYYIVETRPVQTGVTAGPVLMSFSSGTRTDAEPPAAQTPVSLVSATDVGIPRLTGDLVMAAFDANGRLETFGTNASSRSGWGDPLFFEPPPGEGFQYSPSICFGTSYPQGNGAGHLVVVAGDHLWHTMSSPAGWGGWEKMSDTPVASAPDCTVTWDDTVHVVALTATGSVLHAWGTPGNFSANDLGTY